MYGIALALLLIDEVKENSLTFEQSKYLGWISCYFFAFAWIRMLQSLGYMAKKAKKAVLPVKQKAKRVAKEKVKIVEKTPIQIALPPIDENIIPVQ